MLFDADLTPSTRITKLRGNILKELAGMNRIPIRETRFLRAGKISGECWKSPLSLPTLDYSFFRSEQIPFGFAAVRLIRSGVTINLEVDNLGAHYRRTFLPVSLGPRLN